MSEKYIYPCGTEIIFKIQGASHVKAIIGEVRIGYEDITYKAAHLYLL